MDKAQKKIINWLQVYRDGGCKEEARISTLLMDDLEELGYCLLDRSKLRKEINSIWLEYDRVIKDFMVGLGKHPSFSEAIKQTLDIIEGKK